MEIKQPFFSVILPTYNRGASISRALQSILTQEFRNFEVIVVDDGSTDNTKEIVQSFKDERVRYIYQENSERSAARNNGIRNASGAYVCFLDSDDYCLPDHLSSFYNKIKEIDYPVAMFYCNTLEERDGNLVPHEKAEMPARNDVEFVLLNTIGVPRTCIHIDILKRHKFSADINVGEDTDLWVRILQEYPLIYNDAYTTVFCSHGDRTVELTKEYPFKKNIEVKKNIFENYLKGKVPPALQQRVLSNCYFNLGRHYEYVGRKGKMFIALLKSIITDPGNRTKESLYMLLNAFRVSRVILKLRKRW